MSLSSGTRALPGTSGGSNCVVISCFYGVGDGEAGGEVMYCC